jgi:hypothetical protein
MQKQVVNKPAALGIRSCQNESAGMSASSVPDVVRRIQQLVLDGDG